MVARNVANAGGGIISRGGEQLTIRAVSSVTTTDELGDLPLKFGAGVRPLLVRDIADVTVGTKVRTGAATLNGHETVIGTTLMLAGENSRHCKRTVVELFDLDIQAHLLEIAAVVGDIESTTGDEGTLSDPDHVRSGRGLQS